MPSTSHETLADRWADYRAHNPRAYLRNAAKDLGVDEATLLLATSTDLVQLRRDDWPGLVAALRDLGEVRTMTRNDHAVIERTGRFEEVEFFGAMGQVVGTIDLRLFSRHWGHAFVVGSGEEGRWSLQIFDRHGVNVHKVYSDDARARQALLANWVADDQSPPVMEPAQPPAVVRPDSAEAAAALRVRWDAMTDTHQFAGILRDLGLGRVQALRLAGRHRARPVATSALGSVLERAAEAGLPVMIFVANIGAVQIYSGPIHKVARTPGWLNVLDPGFNLHVREAEVAGAWVVTKPGEHGAVTSLECFTASGDTICLIFPKARGNPEIAAAWLALVNDLPPRSDA